MVPLGKVVHFLRGFGVGVKDDGVVKDAEGSGAQQVGRPVAVRNGVLLGAKRGAAATLLVVAPRQPLHNLVQHPLNPRHPLPQRLALRLHKLRHRAVGNRVQKLLKLLQCQQGQLRRIHRCSCPSTTGTCSSSSRTCCTSSIGIDFAQNKRRRVSVHLAKHPPQRIARAVLHILEQRQRVTTQRVHLLNRASQQVGDSRSRVESSAAPLLSLVSPPPLLFFFP